MARASARSRSRIVSSAASSACPRRDPVSSRSWLTTRIGSVGESWARTGAAGQDIASARTMPAIRVLSQIPRGKWSEPGRNSEAERLPRIAVLVVEREGIIEPQRCEGRVDEQADADRRAHVHAVVDLAHAAGGVVEPPYRAHVGEDAAEDAV